MRRQAWPWAQHPPPERGRRRGVQYAIAGLQQATRARPTLPGGRAAALFVAIWQLGVAQALAVPDLPVAAAALQLLGLVIYLQRLAVLAQQCQRPPHLRTCEAAA